MRDEIVLERNLIGSRCFYIVTVTTIALLRKQDTRDMETAHVSHYKVAAKFLPCGSDI